jgi:hypothetical protein
MGCGASTTNGKNPTIIQTEKVKPVAFTERDRRIDDGQAWPDQNSAGIRGANTHNEAVPQAETNQRVSEQLNNNPNFIYNDDILVQQAMHESLMNTEQNQNRNEDEVFDEIIKDALVMSRKEYDDIDRKIKEDEIKLIRDNPELLKKKMETLLNNKKLEPMGKKLPPLQMINKNMKAKKPGKLKDLESVKAPILRQQNTSGTPLLTGRDQNNDGNDTESEIDINNHPGFDKEEVAPSYNPRLLKNNQPVYDPNSQFMSLESQEYANDSLPNFARPNHEETNNDDEYQNLINYLYDDDYNDRDRNKFSAQPSTLDLNNKSAYEKHIKVNTKDSFDDLIDDLNVDDDKPPQKLNNGFPGMAQVEIGNSGYDNGTKKHNNPRDDFDDFEF